MNVLALGSSAFADAAKGVQWPSPTLHKPRAGVLFFKNNCRKIVNWVTIPIMDLSTNLEALAYSNTKIVADGIENTMGRGLQKVFGMRGIKSEMFARYMTFTSWSYKKVGNDWVRDSHAPVPKLVIENELPNWQTPVIPSTGTVNQEDLQRMALSLEDRDQRNLFLKNANLIHPVLTYFVYQDESDWITRVNMLTESEIDLEKKGKAKQFRLTTNQFTLLRLGLIELVDQRQITYH